MELEYGGTESDLREVPATDILGHLARMREKEREKQKTSWRGMDLKPDHCFIEFKLDTPYFGGLSIDYFQRTNEACDAIQASGKIQWQGYYWKIRSDATADFRKMSDDNVRPYIMFVTDQLNPLHD